MKLKIKISIKITSVEDLIRNRNKRFGSETFVSDPQHSPSGKATYFFICPKTLTKATIRKRNFFSQRPFKFFFFI
jgi:hypothetical protein